MVRASEAEAQMSLFDNPFDMMCKRATKKYEDPKAWQNQFYRMVTSEIDDSLFQPLFKEGWMGEPNALIRRRICDYAGETGENLMERCFERLTAFHVSKFRIQSKAVRMDRKLKLQEEEGKEELKKFFPMFKKSANIV